MTSTVRLLPCPTCRKPTAFTSGNPWRPFCSERCRSTDLGAWAAESYRVAAEAPPDADEPAAPPSH